MPKSAPEKFDALLAAMAHVSPDGGKPSAKGQTSTGAASAGSRQTRKSQDKSQDIWAKPKRGSSV